MQESVQALPGKLLVLLTDPTSNLSAAFILYGIIGIIVLILLVVAIMYLMAAPEDEETDSESPEGTTSATSAGSTSGVGSAALRRPRVPRAPRVRTPRSVALTTLVLIGVIAGVWVLAGFTTSTPVVCEGCHVDTSHSTAEQGMDPHAKSACVSCHEPGGRFGRYVSGVPSRLVHFIDGAVDTSMRDEYGQVTKSACLACHGAGISEPTLNEKRGLRMSHAEPLAASASCLDCHTPRAGVVATYNAGMNPCLRCHDSKTASSECATCHDRKAAAAARSRETSFAVVQIAEVKCGGCHDEKKECDTCHGTRMPHSRAFMASAHARAGAVDFWYNGGKTCARCHTAVRRPCTKCHGPLLGRGHLANNATVHQDGNSAACDRCHQRWAPTNTRDFCADVCHSKAAVAESPR